MKIIEVNANNLEQEHICCALSGSKNALGVTNKKAWLSKAFNHGLTFKKLDVRGKVFVEYIPSEYAWRPVIAKNYLFIHCLWVSGRYKGQSWGKQLLAETEADAQAQNKDGVCLVSSKANFLTDTKFFKSQGYELCDTAPPYFDLMVKKFNSTAQTPQFTPAAKALDLKDKEGIVIYYTHQCPFNTYYIQEMKTVADVRHIPFKIILLDTFEKAQTAPSAYGTFNLFFNGQFLTHYIQTAKQFDKMLDAALE